MPDAYQPAPTGKATASFSILKDGVAAGPVAWSDTAGPHTVLFAISVFDRDCGSVHVQEKRHRRPFRRDAQGAYRGGQDRARHRAGRVRPRRRPDDPSRADHAGEIAAFTEVMRANVMNGETPFRRAYIRSVIDRSKSMTRKSGLSAGEPFSNASGGGVVPAGVPSFVRKWRAIQTKTANSYVIEIAI